MDRRCEYRELYHKVEERNPCRNNIIATVVEGEHIGEKVYLSDGEVIWESGKGTILAENKGKWDSVQSTGLVSIGLVSTGLVSAGLVEQEGMRVFCEKIGNQPVMVICGGGHVSIPIIYLAKSIGFRTIVLEDRPLFADHARAAGADQVICEAFDQAMEKIQGTPDTYFIIVTRGHRYDAMCLRAAVLKKNAYVGMMGSRKRVGIVREKLAEEGIPIEKLEKVHMPIGLSIGAETPEELAVSIMAEVIQVKNRARRSGDYTKELLDVLTGKKDEEKKRVLAVIVSRKGSAPREIGTKMLILEDGTTVGTIGGGCAEGEVIRKAILMMRREECLHEVLKVDMTGKEAEDAGMVCGGTIEVYMEMF